MSWVVLCLGNEPKAFGPFASEKEADDHIEANTVDGVCGNGLLPEEHHNLELIDPKDVTTW